MSGAIHTETKPYSIYMMYIEIEYYNIRLHDAINETKHSKQIKVF